MPPLAPEPVPEPWRTGSPSRTQPPALLPLPMPPRVKVGFSQSLWATSHSQSAQVKLPRNIQRLARRLLNTSAAPRYSDSVSPLYRISPPRVLTFSRRRQWVTVRVEPSGIG